MSHTKKNAFEQLLKNHLSAPGSQSDTEPCPDENWMAAYLEGSPGKHFKTTFERHLLQCSRCRAELALLLKASATDVEPVRATETPQPGFLSGLLSWVGAGVFRPAFAILMVCVVTGVVGYRLLRNDEFLMERQSEVSQSRRPLDLPTAVAPEPSRVQTSPEPPRGSNGAALSEHREAAADKRTKGGSLELRRDDVQSKNKVISRDQDMKDDAFAAEPPSNAPAEADKEVEEASRREIASAQQSSPGPRQKETLPTSAPQRQNTQLQAKMDEPSGKPHSAVQPAAPAQVPQSLGGLSGAKAEQDKSPNAQEAGAASSLEKKQVLAKRARQGALLATDETRAVKHLESGGKQFELSDNAWRDVSILPGDPKPILVKSKSPVFEKLRKELAPFQTVLTRPEDVLIKLDSRVFRIQKEP